MPQKKSHNRIIEFSAIGFLTCSYLYMITGGSYIILIFFILFLIFSNLLISKFGIARPSLIDFLVFLLTVSFTLPVFLGREGIYGLVIPVAGLVIWYGLRNIIRDEKAVAAILKGVYLFSIIIAAVIVFRLLAGVDVRRIAALGGSGNQTAILLFIGSYMAFLKLIDKKNMLKLLTFLFLVVSLLLTTGRSSWLALTLAIGVYIFKSKKSIFDSKSLALLVVSTLAFATLGLASQVVIDEPSKNSPLLNAYERVVDYGGKEGTSGRDEIWAYAIEIGLQYPVAGYGWNIVERFEDFTALGVQVSSPHNTFLNTFLRSGLLGFTLLISMIWFVWSRVKDNDVLLPLYIGILAISIFESFAIGGLIIRNMLFTLIFVMCVADRR